MFQGEARLRAPAPRIAVLLTCHNRRDKTLACLGALFANHLPGSVSLHVFLVDDGCTDGTAVAVREKFPQVKIFEGDGSLYWNGGMRLAFGEALKTGYDYYLWLNDDTILFFDAIARLLATVNELYVKKGKAVIVVGTTVDPQTGQITYGGRRRASRIRPMRFELVIPKDVPVACDTMNGNCVLIPSGVAVVVGNLDAAFEHTMGDMDYGLRAHQTGFGVWVSPSVIGACPTNPRAGMFLNPELPFPVRLRNILHPKNLPFFQWGIFTRRHAGFLWPIYWFWPYINMALCRRKMWKFRLGWRAKIFL